MTIMAGGASTTTFHTTLVAVVNINSDTNLAITFDSNKDAEAGYRFNSDGTVDRADNVNETGFTYFQINSGTDWIIPNSASSGPATFHIRATHVSESDTPVKTGVMNTWLALTSDRQWDANRDRLGGNGISQWVIDIAISDDGGSTTLDTARYTMNAEIDV